MKELFRSKENGFSIVEVLISMAIATILMVSFISLTIQAKKINRLNLESLKAELYLVEMIEVTKDLEKTSWDTLSNANCSVTQCHPEINFGSWIISPSTQLLGGIYTRGFKIEDVYRNQLSYPNEIIGTGGVLDPNTKKIYAEVSWLNGGSNKSLSLETYVYKY